MKELTICGIRCLLKEPAGYTEGARDPLLIFLHGAGTRGDDISVLQNSPFCQTIQEHTNLPFLVLMPLCQQNTWYDVWQDLKEFVQKAIVTLSVDSSRVYLMGASMGGYATWQLAMSMPEVFAAIAPICGGGMYWNAGRLQNVPVWAFHGAKDNVVFVEESQKMVDAVNRCGGNAKLTIYPENGHDAWSDTYANPEVFSWLLQHRKAVPQEFTDQYNNAALYG